MSLFAAPNGVIVAGYKNIIRRAVGGSFMKKKLFIRGSEIADMIGVPIVYLEERFYGL